MKSAGLLSRRNLLVGLGAVGTGALLIGFAAMRLGAPSQDAMRRFVSDVVRHYLPGVRISDAAIEQFAGDFVMRSRARPDRRLALLARMPYGTVKRVVALTGQQRLQRAVERLESEVLTRFMFSTGYFDTAGTERPRLAYKGFNDPYKVGCSNPLAQPVEA